MFITKNGMVKSVTKGVYKESYEANGWVPCDNPELFPKAHTGKTFMSPQPKMKDSYNQNLRHTRHRQQFEQEFMEDYSSDNFEDMSYQELLAYAKEQGIQLGRVRKQEDIISLLRGEYE